MRSPAWDATNVQTPAVNVSCEPDEYVVGISANIRIFNDTDCDGRSHVITSVDFECSGEDLGKFLLYLEMKSGDI